MNESLTVNNKEEGKKRRGDAFPLPPFKIPFAVKPNYQIRSDLVKMPAELFGQRHDKHFVIDEQYFRYVEAKLEQLQHHPELCHVYAKKYDEQALVACAQLIFKKLADEYPEYVSVQNSVILLHLLGLKFDINSYDVTFIGDRVGGEGSLAPTDELRLRLRDYLKRQNSLERVWNLFALAVQEDLVIVKDDGDMGVSELMHVCLPSHWNPGERVGQSLFGLHEPVANNEQLLKASRNTLLAMVNKGPFVRFVWSLNSTDELNLNPAFHTHGRKKPLGDDPSQWFFRVERQTTLPLSDLQRSLFTIRILVAPLASVLNDERKQLLAQAVLSMDEKLLSYKGLVKQKDVLLEYLRR